MQRETHLAVAERMEDEHPWLELAACKDMNPDLFFPEPGDGYQAALVVCRGCSVREPCLDFALATRERYGIWGGATARQRRRMLRKVVA